MQEGLFSIRAANLQQMAKEWCYFAAADAARRHGALTKLRPMKIMACLSEEHMHRTSAEGMGSTRAEQRITLVVVVDVAAHDNAKPKKISLSRYIQYKYIYVFVLSALEFEVSTVLARKTAGRIKIFILFYQISPNLQMAKVTVNVMSDTSSI